MIDQQPSQTSARSFKADPILFADYFRSPGTVNPRA